MLKLINSSYRCLGVSADQISSELSLGILYLPPSKRYSKACALQKHAYNVINVNRKTIIPEFFSRAYSVTVTYDVKKKIVPFSLHNKVKMSNSLLPEANHNDSPVTTPSSIRASASNICNAENDLISKKHQTQNTKIPPDFRVWESITKRSGHDGETFRFKVLSYNVLAQYLLEWHPYLYRNCATHCLKWNYRSMLLLDEISQLSPDILCLQEVQCSHIPTFYNKLEEIGYVGIFKQKTGHRQDGCAIYFKDNMFQLKDCVSVEFYQPDLPLLDRDNIGVIVKLIPRSMPDSPIIVATTHLLYNPKRTDVRLAQIQVFLAEIDRFAFSSKSGRGHMPIILTGDLNSTPESAVIHLLQCGNVHVSQYRSGCDWRNIGVTDNCQHLAVYLNRLKGDTQRIAPNDLMIQHTSFSDHKLPEAPTIGKEMTLQNPQLFNSGVLGHSLQLASVYDHVKYNGECEASTFQDRWVTVDYIYFSYQNRLKLLERLYLPTANECQVLHSLPNDVFGSDHLAIGAIFELIPVKSKI